MSDNDDPKKLYRAECRRCGRLLFLPFAAKRSKLCEECAAVHGQPREWRLSVRRAGETSGLIDNGVRCLEGD